MCARALTTSSQCVKEPRAFISDGQVKAAQASCFFFFLKNCMCIAALVSGGNFLCLSVVESEQLVKCVLL